MVDHDLRLATARRNREVRSGICGPVVRTGGCCGRAYSDPFSAAKLDSAAPPKASAHAAAKLCSVGTAEADSMSPADDHAKRSANCDCRLAGIGRADSCRLR